MGRGLRAVAEEMNHGIAFMEGRTKRDMKTLIDEVVTVKDFDFLTGKKNVEYAVFILKEDPENFYFGGKLLTEALKAFEEKGLKQEIQEDGLVVLFGEKRGKDQTYVTTEFFPVDKASGLELSPTLIVVPFDAPPAETAPAETAPAEKAKK